MPERNYWETVNMTQAVRQDNELNWKWHIGDVEDLAKEVLGDKELTEDILARVENDLEWLNPTVFETIENTLLTIASERQSQYEGDE